LKDYDLEQRPELSLPRVSEHLLLLHVGVYPQLRGGALRGDYTLEEDGEYTPEEDGERQILLY